VAVGAQTLRNCDVCCAALETWREIGGAGFALEYRRCEAMGSLSHTTVQQEAVTAVDRLADKQLLDCVKSLAVHERHATARLIAALAEMERRRLYLGQGCSSLFTYCTEVLGLSEDAAYNRVQAVHTGLRFPVVFRDLESGALTLTAVRVLAPMLTPENHLELLDSARHRSSREVKALAGSLAPAPPAAADSFVIPIGAGAYLFHFAAPQATFDKFVEAQALLRHALPDGDIAAVLDRAIEALLRDLKRSKMGAVRRPRVPTRAAGGSRRIPAHVRRAVWARDGARCAYVGPEGRCSARALLELHHVVPFADGGEATVENIQLRCRAHNAYEAEQWDRGSVAENSPFRNGG
jgi:5-methylcytosine-specific restriction endonuclease McrA